MNDISDPPAEPTQALQRIEGQQIVDSPMREITPQQARNESIAHTLDAAYARASLLQLTPEEAKKLMEPFPDEDIRTGARGKDNLIYLEHAAVRRRLMEVFGPGQWTIINRRSWLDEQGGWLYADVVLVCRGCFVGECIGANRFSAKNAAVNYADAVKGAESDALGRIAGTALGVGLQLWSKGFSEEWMARNRGHGAPPPRPAPKPVPQPNVERTAATPAAVLPATATDKTREWAWNHLAGEFGPDAAWSYLVTRGWVNAESNDYSTWNLDHVPTSKPALAALADHIRATLPKSEPSQQIVDSKSSGDLPPEIADCVITVPRRGQKRDQYLAAPDTIGSLYVAMKSGDQEAQKRLWGLVKGWNPEPYVDANGKKWPVKAEDAQCRADLDMFADHYERTHGKSGT